jgi:hypothetical protein
MLMSATGRKRTRGNVRFGSEVATKPVAQEWVECGRSALKIRRRSMSVGTGQWLTPP